MPLLLLLFYQWRSFGNPFLPGQHWMPPGEGSERGYQGYGLPQLELLIALASGNHIYPLLLNSFRHCYANLAGQFFSDPTVVPVVFDFHKEMVKAIQDKNETSAARIMERMLNHGAENLKRADSS